MTLHTTFDKDFDPRTSFPTEQAIRLNFGLFRAHCYRILQKRNLPKSHVALTTYLAMIPEGKKEIRKDAMTRREQHEESHIDTIDKLLTFTNSEWLDPQIYGSEDALFVAIICHDIVEDFSVSPKMVKSLIKSGLDNLRQNGSHLDELSEEEIDADLDKAMEMVMYLSRKDEMGNLVVGDDRIEQAKRWLEHPYLMPIKLIDWANKLQTMPGVDHFEENGFERMVKVLDETALLFIDEQQNFVGQAIEKYPQIEQSCQLMQQYVSMLFQMLRTYKTLQEGKVKFDPENANPFNFNASLEQIRDLLPLMLPGNNYIEPFIERLDGIASNDPQVAKLIKYMIEPAFSNLENQNIPALQKHLQA